MRARWKYVYKQQIKQYELIMASFQTKQIDLNTDDLDHSKHYDPNALGGLYEKLVDTIVNKAIAQMVGFGSLKKEWLPEDKTLELPEKNTAEYNNFIANIRSFLKNNNPGAVYIEQYVSKLNNEFGALDFVHLKAVVIFESNQIYNYMIENYGSFFQDVSSAPVIIQDAIGIQDVEISPQLYRLHKVFLINENNYLALRNLPCSKSIPAPDIYDTDKQGALAELAPTQVGDLGGLIGLLPNETVVKITTDGLGFAGTWSEVTIISGPTALDSNLIGESGFVDNQMLTSVTNPVPVITGQETPEELEILDLVSKELNPPVIEVVTEESTPTSAVNTSAAPRQDWTTRTPSKVFRNKRMLRYEVTIELDYYPYNATTGISDILVKQEALLEYKQAKKIEARKAGLKEVLKYFNTRHDNSYLASLLNAGSGEMAQLTGPWADDNPNNRKIYFQVEIPYTGAGGFNYKVHEQAETLTIKEMIVERVVDFQYAFSTNKIQENIKKIIKILREVITPGINSYDGTIDNSPDIDYQVKKMEEVIPAIKEILSENNIKFREDKEDLIELGLDSDLKIMYIRFAPEDGKDGSWRIR